MRWLIKMHTLRRIGLRIGGILLAGLALGTLPAAARIVINPASIEAWSDRTFIPAFEERRFSGLAIAVVKDGEVVFAKGYGYADFARKTPMDPARTEVRIGSVTKVFTATAIAQLLERGLISSLDDPANLYLKRVKLPQAFGREITLWHLLTHQVGFEDTAYGMASLDPPQTPVSAADIKRFMPAIVRQPGTVSVYSNYSTALLGIIIEDITGQTVDQYFAEHIFAPLGMSNSRLSQDVTPSKNLGQPYAFFPNGEAQPVRYVGVHPLIAPAGAITTTAMDMTRFMAAHIGEGRDGRSGILSPQSYQLMHARKTGNHEAVTGFGMKFIVSDWNGERLVEHGGGWPGFQTVMELFPDSGVGIFISIMGGEPQVGLGEQLLSLVTTTRLAPVPGHAVKRPMQLTDARQLILTHLLGDYRQHEVSSPVDTTAFIGTYWRERRSYTTIEALFQLLSANTSLLTVAAGDDGSLSMNGVAGYRPVRADVFLKSGYGPTLDGDPNAVELFAFSQSGAQAERVAPLLSVDVWTRASNVWNPRTVMQSMAILFLIGVTGIFAAFWPAGSRQSRVAKWLPLVFTGLVVALPLSLLAGYDEGDGLMYALLLGEPARFVMLVVFANAAAAVAVVMAVLAVYGWRGGYWGVGKRAIARRAHYTLLAVAALGFIPCLAFVNLLGVHLP